jgi:hypothetical protein
VSIAICPITPDFVAEVGDVDLSRPLAEDDEAAIKAAFWTYVVLIFPGQQVTPEQHQAFTERFEPVEADRVLNRDSTSTRFDTAFTDISNLYSGGRIWAQDSRQRMYKAGNRLWHTDSSFKFRPGLCSLLYARTVAPIGGHTEFADQRTAYDALPDAMKKKLEGLVAEHSIATSRKRSGFTDFSAEESQRLPPGTAGAGAHHPAKRAQVALRRIPRRPHLRHARRGRTDPDRRTHRARIAAPVRSRPPLARARSRHVGQPLHHAPGHRLRRSPMGAGHAARHGERCRQHLRAGRHRGAGLAPGTSHNRTARRRGARPGALATPTSIAGSTGGM